MDGRGLAGPPALDVSSRSRTWLLMLKMVRRDSNYPESRGQGRSIRRAVRENVAAAARSAKRSAEHNRPALCRTLFGRGEVERADDPVGQRRQLRVLRLA